MEATTSQDAHLVRVLPWDFRTCFPESVDPSSIPALAGAGDNRVAVLRAFHNEKSAQGLALLAKLDAAMETKRMTIEPQTAHEKPQEEKAFEQFILEYVETFGKQAGEAFRKAVRVWHLGGAVITSLPPTGCALPTAVDRASFGYEEDGIAVVPSEEECFEITAELADYLRDLEDPATREKLLGHYAADFGQEAADTLDRWSRCINVVEEQEIDALQYDPGHPWHYYSEGDAAEPMPACEIPAATKYELPTAPKNPRKRLAFFQQLLVDQEKQLREDMDRYTELAEKGAEALSEYDRNIAHANNEELGWASAIALKFNHIRYGQARVAAIRSELKQGAKGT